MTPGRYRQRLMLHSQVSKHCEEVFDGRGVWPPPSSDITPCYVCVKV